MAKTQSCPNLFLTHHKPLPLMNSLLPTAIRTLSPLLLKPRTSSLGPTKALVADLKENWLDSLSCPFREEDVSSVGPAAGWVVGIDPDASGAIAVIKDGGEQGNGGCCAQVFDTPHLQVPVGKRLRKRLDAKSIVQLLHSFEAPLGTTAYIEQSNPFPKDGKQGWWSGGFTYGLWLGVLVSSGFSVVPISSRLWKDHFDLFRNSSTKDDSRKAASDLFPSLSSSLKRKKDHGRAEALLIAAYGKGLRIQSETSLIQSEALIPELFLEGTNAS